MNFFEAYLKAKEGEKITIEGETSWWLEFKKASSSGSESLDICSKDRKSAAVIDTNHLVHWLDSEWKVYKEPTVVKFQWAVCKHENITLARTSSGGCSVLCTDCGRISHKLDILF